MPVKLVFIDFAEVLRNIRAPIYSPKDILFEVARMADATIAPAVEDATVDASAAAGKQDINPWSVSGEVGEDGKVKAIDYRKLIDEFGTSLIDDALLERWERVTGSKPHRFMRRGIVFSHRDLTTILDRYEKVRGKKNIRMDG